VTALREPHRLKWGDLVRSDTPLPTPWNKAVFEKKSRAIQERRKKLRESGAPEEELEALFRRYGVDFVDIDTGDDYITPLSRFFRARARRR